MRRSDTASRHREVPGRRGWRSLGRKTALLAQKALGGAGAPIQRFLIAGISYDGGYQEYMTAPVEALAAMAESFADLRQPHHPGLGFWHADRLGGHFAIRRAVASASHDREYPLEKAAEAYARMMRGRAEFRVVLTM